MSRALRIWRHEVTLSPESSRVIIRPFIPSEGHRIAAIVGKALALTEEQVSEELHAIFSEFEARHLNLKSSLENHLHDCRRLFFRKRSFPLRDGFCSALSFQESMPWNQQHFQPLDGSSSQSGQSAAGSFALRDESAGHR